MRSSYLLPVCFCSILRRLRASIPWWQFKGNQPNGDGRHEVTLRRCPTVFLFYLRCRKGRRKRLVKLKETGARRIEMEPHCTVISRYPQMAPCVGRENTFEISCNDDWMIKVERQIIRRHAGTPGCSNCATARGGGRIKYMSWSNRPLFRAKV